MNGHFNRRVSVYDYIQMNCDLQKKRASVLREKIMRDSRLISPKQWQSISPAPADGIFCDSHKNDQS